MSKKIKVFRDFRVFVLSSTPKTKTQKCRKFYKNTSIPSYENVASKRVEILFESYQSQNDSPIFAIRYQVIVF